MNIIKRMISSINNIGATKELIQQAMVEERKVLEESESVAEMADRRLKELTELSYDDLLVLRKNKKVMISSCGKYIVDYYRKNECEFKFSLRVRKYNDGTAPWVYRDCNREEVDLFFSLIEAGNRIVFITEDQKNFLDLIYRSYCGDYCVDLVTCLSNKEINNRMRLGHY